MTRLSRVRAHEVKCRDLDKRYQKVREEAEELRLRRNSAIVKAVAGGVSPSDLARELGITRGRVWQILERK